MTIKQLRYIVAVTDNQFNISQTAEKLFVSQPGISKQIKLLEESLGCEIFVRNGKALHRLSEKGQQIVDQARIVMTEYDNLKSIAQTETYQQHTTLSIATTPTQATYVLPDALAAFHQKHKDIQLRIHEGTTDQLIDIANNREADCVIFSGINHRLQRQWMPHLLMIPCYEWYQHLLCPSDSPLTKKETISTQDIANNAIITYPASKRQTSAVELLLEAQQLPVNLFATANDPRTIKDYVSKKMGIGIIAPMAFNPSADKGLTSISLAHLLPKCTTVIGVERHNLLKPHVYDFIKFFAPHLAVSDIEKAISNEDDFYPSKSKLPDQIGTWEI